MKNPFRTIYRVCKYRCDAAYYVEYQRWWQCEWHTHSAHDTKEDAIFALKILKL